MPLRVGIELSTWSSRRGYGRFTRGLVRALLALEDDIEYVFFVDPRTPTAELPRRGEVVPLPFAAVPKLGETRSLGAMRSAGRVVASRPVDLLFFPSVHAWLPVRSPAPVLLGIQDVIAEDYPQLIFPRLDDRWRWRFKSWWARRGAAAILTVSEFSRRGIVRRFGLSPEQVFVVEEAADPVFRLLAPHEIDRELLARLGMIDGAPKIAYLGGVNPHKNLPALVDAVIELRARPGLESTRLWIVGDPADRFTPGIEELRTHLRRRAAESVVVFTGFLSDADVVQVLNAACVLALPSWSEGFGLPAVEAAACATPVVATSSSPMPELLAGGGLFFDPARTDELTEALARILSDRTLRETLGATARERAAALTWKRSAERFREVLVRLGAEP